MTDDRAALSVAVVEQAHGVVVLSLTGELDFVSGGELSARLGQIPVDAGANVVFDVSAVRFIDSTGLNALVTSSKSIEANDGVVILAGASPHVRRVFEITQIGHTFRLEDTLDSALRALRLPSTDR